MTEKNAHWGITLDTFLAEEGVLESTKAEAVTRVLGWRLSQERKGGD